MEIKLEERREFVKKWFKAKCWEYSSLSILNRPIDDMDCDTMDFLKLAKRDEQLSKYFPQETSQLRPTSPVPDIPNISPLRLLKKLKRRLASPDRASSLVENDNEQESKSESDNELQQSFRNYDLDDQSQNSALNASESPVKSPKYEPISSESLSPSPKQLVTNPKAILFDIDKFQIFSSKFRLQMENCTKERPQLIVLSSDEEN